MLTQPPSRVPRRATDTRRNNRLFVAYLILIAWLPFPFGSHKPWAWAILEVGAFILTALWLWGYLGGRYRINRTAKTAWPALALLLVWLGCVLTQFVPLPFGWVETLSPRAAELHALGRQIAPAYATLSVDPRSTADAWLLSLAYVLLFALTLLLVDNRSRLRQLAYVLVFGGLFQALYGSLMTLSGLEYGFFRPKVTHVGLATGTFISRNSLAGYLEMCLAVGIGLLIANLGSWTGLEWRQRIRNAIALLLSAKMRLRLYLVVMVIALVLTRSRMGNTAFFSSLLIAGSIGLLFSRHATRATVVLLASLIIIDILIVGAWFGVDRVAQRISETTLKEERRGDVIGHTLKYWSDYRLVGSGLGSYYAVSPNYSDDALPRAWSNAHNDYLEFAAETGAIGLSILSLFVATSLIAALRAHYRRRDPLMRGMSFGAIMGVTALLIHATADFNHQVPANAATFMLLLAIGWISLVLKERR